MSGNVFPAISEPYISLFEYLIFLPGPGCLFEVGVKVVAVSLSEVLALLSWKGKGELVPAEFSSVELDQFNKFFISFGCPIPPGIPYIKR